MPILSVEDIEQIHEQSLRVLEQTGVQVDDEAVLELLKERGCTGDRKAGIVRFTREAVSEALKRAPRAVKLCALSGETTVLRAGGSSVFWSGNAVNLARGKEATPIDTDLFADLVHVLDGLEHLHGIVGPCLEDVPAPVRGLAGMRLIAEASLKHIRPCIYHPSETKGMIEMAQVLLDGRTIAEAPFFSLGYTAVSPLRWSQTALAAFRESSGFGVPVMVNSEPAGGVSAPVTLAGELVLGNAEALSGVVIVQALEPGRPVIFNMGFAHVLDMQTAVMRTGAVENALLQAAGAEIAAYHGLPSAAWLSTESCVADPGAAYEYTLTGLSHAQSRASVIWGIGNLESTKCMSLEMAVIGNDIAGALLRAQQGIRVDEESLATELIEELGQHAGYLENPHTLEHFKQEYYFPRVTNRQPRSMWEAAGRQTMLDKATARVEELRARPIRTIVTPAQRSELLRIEKAWTRALVGA